MSTLYYLALVVLVALAVTFTIQLAEKRGYRDFAIDHTKGLLQQMLQCDFCLGFWTSLIISIVLIFVLNNWGLLAMPIFITPLVRYMLN